MYELTSQGIIRVNPINTFLLWLIGIPKEDMERIPGHERYKLKAMAAVIMVPPLISLFSGFYFFYTSFGNLYLSILTTIVFSTLVLLIDRFVVITLKAQTKVRNHFRSPSIYLRIFLAVSIAYVISIPVELRLFEGTINQKLFDNRSAQLGSINNSYLSQINTLDKLLAAKENVVLNLQTSYLGEADGSMGTYKRGDGKIAKLKLAEYEKSKKDFDEFMIIYNQRRNNLSNENKKEVEQINANQSNDILAKLKALSQLKTENIEIWIYTWSIFLVLILFDLIPIIGKLMMKPGMIDEVYTAKELECGMIFRMEKEILISLYSVNLENERAYQRAKLESDYSLKKAELLKQDAKLVFSENEKFENILAKHMTKIDNMKNENAKQFSKSKVKEKIEKYFLKNA